MQKAYQDFDIQFLPDRVVQEFNQKILTTHSSLNYDSLITKPIDLNHSITTQLVSAGNLFQKDPFFNTLNFLNQEFHDSALKNLEKFLEL
jgi:hypothetical protein